MKPGIQTKQSHSPKYKQGIFQSGYRDKCHKYKENHSADNEACLNFLFSLFVQSAFVQQQSYHGNRQNSAADDKK